MPWIAYVATCSAHAYWLDSGEFVAVSVRLDISHPPGHPLSALYGKFWSLLPIGALPLRVAVGQAAASALACVMACRACLALLRRLDVPEPLACAEAATPKISALAAIVVRIFFISSKRLRG